MNNSGYTRGNKRLYQLLQSVNDHGSTGNEVDQHKNRRGQTSPQTARKSSNQRRSLQNVSSRTSHEHVSKLAVPPPPYDSEYPDIHTHTPPRRAVDKCSDTLSLNTHRICGGPSGVLCSIKRNASSEIYIRQHLKLELTPGSRVLLDPLMFHQPDKKFHIFHFFFYFRCRTAG